MAPKHYNKPAVLGLAVILIIVLVLIIYVGYDMSTVKSSSPPSDNTGLSSSSPSSNNSPSASASVWSSIYVVQQNGNTYWINAPQSFSLSGAAVYSSESGQGNDFSEISTCQNTIYMQLAESATSWQFSCQEGITLDSTSGNVVSTIAPPTTINQNGGEAAANQNIQVTTGGTLTEAQFQSILNQPAGNYYYVVTLNNIMLTVTVNGQTTTLTASQGTQSNVLAWLIQIK
jgi:hypothetical protein